MNILFVLHIHPCPVIWIKYNIAGKYSSNNWWNEAPFCPHWADGDCPTQGKAYCVINKARHIHACGVSMGGEKGPCRGRHLPESHKAWVDMKLAAARTKNWASSTKFSSCDVNLVISLYCYIDCTNFSSSSPYFTLQSTLISIISVYQSLAQFCKTKTLTFEYLA